MYTYAHDPHVIVQYYHNSYGCAQKHFQIVYYTTTVTLIVYSYMTLLGLMHGLQQIMTIYINHSNISNNIVYPVIIISIKTYVSVIIMVQT